MGCDIHVYTEAINKDFSTGESTWVNVDYWTINPYWPDPDDDYEKPYNIVHLYRDRNYVLFGLLAMVRNDTYESIACKPKGLPPDVSLPVQYESDQIDVDGHSHSYLTLRELLELRERFMNTPHSGYLDEDDFIEYKKTGTPLSWWTEKEMLAMRHLRNDASVEYTEWMPTVTPMDELIIALIERWQRVSFFFNVREEIKLDDKKFLSKIDQDSIRIVFWFDN